MVVICHAYVVQDNRGGMHPSCLSGDLHRKKVLMLTREALFWRDMLAARSLLVVVLC